MKQKKFLTLVTAALVLGALAWFLHRSERDAWQDRPLQAGEAFFDGLPVNDVALVRLEDADGRVTLRRGEAQWVVEERDDHPSNFGDIADLILQVSRLQARQAVPVGESDLGQLSLRMPGDGHQPEETGLRLHLEDEAGRPLVTMLLGKLHYTTLAGQGPEVADTATGRYVLDPQRPGVAYLVTTTFDQLRAKPPAWLDRTFVTTGMAKRVAVEAEDEERRWILQRDQPGGAWNLAGLRRNQTLDTSRVLDVDTMLGSMVLADVAEGPEDDRIQPLEDRPVRVVVETFDDLRYAFTVGAGEGDTLPVRVVVEAVASDDAEAAGGDEAEAASAVREEQLAQAAKFRDQVVLVPRNFFEPFFAPRSSLIGPPPPND